jgi:hypothetical protein
MLWHGRDSPRLPVESAIRSGYGSLASDLPLILMKFF